MVRADMLEASFVTAVLSEFEQSIMCVSLAYDSFWQQQVLDVHSTARTWILCNTTSAI